MYPFWRLGALCGTLLCFMASLAHAHGIVGQRKFIEPFFTEDANPKNEFVLAKPEFSDLAEGGQSSVGFSLEKKLLPNLSLALENEWISSPRAGEEDAAGFQNLGILLKYALFQSEAHEFIASFGLEVEVPVGDKDIGAERDVALKPRILFGKGLGNLPSALGFLRPFALMGDGGFEIPFSEEQTETKFLYGLALMYDLQYLQTFVRDLGIPWPLSHLLPLVEWNFETAVNGPQRKTEAFLTPGLVYRGDRYLQLGVAGRFPLNSTTNREFKSGVLFMVDLFYDDIFPALTWTPF